MTCYDLSDLMITPYMNAHSSYMHAKSGRNYLMMRRAPRDGMTFIRCVNHVT